MYEILWCIRFSVCWISPFLQSSVLQTYYTAELGQSSFSRLLGSFLHICMDLFLYERKQITCENVPIERSQRLGERGKELPPSWGAKSLL